MNGNVLYGLTRFAVGIPATSCDNKSLGHLDLHERQVQMGQLSKVSPHHQEIMSLHSDDPTAICPLQHCPPSV